MLNLVNTWGGYKGSNRTKFYFTSDDVKYDCSGVNDRLHH